eukprot:TRINITY_DN17672_c0_g1_i1.p1 TRINITY_DN17672_c0_g1~~TRINITY_DN17672_c0_g1_i1.p1  ORF type:complete len:435 (+),score=148.06 TRINITY_DN17672_c0_g1_i1:57-1307(+)
MLRPQAMGKVAPTTVAQTLEKMMITLYGKGSTPQDIQPIRAPHSDCGRLLHVDAVGVCNLLSLHTYYDGKGGFLERAQAVAGSAHSVLTKNRTLQKGVQAGTWLGDASEQEPLVGGLRSGKVMGEEVAQGDGQNWYSLMTWAFSLNRLSAGSGDGKYNLLAAQLLMAAAPKFLAFGDDADSAATEGLIKVGANSVSKGPTMVHPRMSIDLTRPLKASPRATDPLVGAFVCGLVRAGLVRDRDRPVLASLERLEQRLLTIWERVPAQELERLRSDPTQIGDALWVGAWAKGRKWAAAANQRGLDGLKHLLDTGALQGEMRGRYPPGELWMIAGAKAAEEAEQALPCSMDVLDALAAEKLAPRLSLWGPIGLVFYGPARMGGVFLPSWMKHCREAAKTDRNDPVGRRVTTVDDSPLGL